MQYISPLWESAVISFYQNSLIFLFFLFAAFLAIFFSRLYLFKKGTSLKYRAKEFLFTPAEHSFFFVLKSALSDEFEVFAQVRIADVLNPDYPRSSRMRQIALNKITSKHFDYVLCRRKTLAVVAAIELDDSSHQLSDRVIRDRFIEGACDSAGLKLIRFSCKSQYQLNAVRAKVLDAIGG